MRPEYPRGPRWTEFVKDLFQFPGFFQDPSQNLNGIHTNTNRLMCSIELQNTLQ